MRVLRVLVGVLLLLVAVPTLILGGGGWYAMQHRDADGWFRASMTPVDYPGYAIVVPDLDGMLRRDAPISRAGRTGLAITATSPGRRLFVGIASPNDVVNLLGNAAYTRIDQIHVARGPVALTSTPLAGAGRPTAYGPAQPIWLRAGGGRLDLDPEAWRGQNVALVVLAADGNPLGSVDLVGAVNPYWLNTMTWSLVILGVVMLGLGIAVFAWTRRRPVLYVLENVPRQPDSPSPAEKWFPQPPAVPPAVPSPTAAPEVAFSDAETIHPLGAPTGLAWPFNETNRATGSAIAAETQWLPLVPVVSPLQVPTAEMPLVDPPSRALTNGTH